MHAVFLKLLLLHLFLTFFLQDMDCAMMRQLIANLSLGNLISGHSMWDVWWTKWHWDSFFFPGCFGFSTVIIIAPVLHTDPLIYHRCQKILVINGNIT